MVGSVFGVKRFLDLVSAVVKVCPRFGCSHCRCRGLFSGSHFLATSTWSSGLPACQGHCRCASRCACTARYQSASRIQKHLLSGGFLKLLNYVILPMCFWEAMAQVHHRAATGCCAKRVSRFLLARSPEKWQQLFATDLFYTGKEMGISPPSGYSTTLEARDCLGMDLCFCCTHLRHPVSFHL